MDRLIYAADDEENIRVLIRSFLEKEGFEVVTFPDGEALLEQFRTKPSDLVVLDVMMPGRNGFLICQDLRSLSNVPIIMLTAKTSDADFIAGITLGSDDYMTKPFSPMALVMKVRAMFRRVEMDREEVEPKLLSFMDISIDHQKKEVRVKDNAVELAPNEYSLLRYLVENQHRAVSREELLDKVWGYTTAVETRVTDDTMKRLRKKLSGSDVVIETVWGYGFRMRTKE
ncbi:MAG TPA: response regulator transcription factor [Clostridiaceae bacterium]|nr:response regulator transcription factor [Clostridiaceae bacterium]